MNGFLKGVPLAPRLGSNRPGRLSCFVANRTCSKQYECMVSQEGLSVRGRFKRQPHVKLCAIRTRAEVDFSVMPFDDDPVADNQAESRA